jgi:hypothetical protein
VKTISSLLLLALTVSPPTRADTPHDWQVAGRLGLMQFIVVPEASARDGRYHRAIVDELCDREDTCFLRFFTNSTGAQMAFPLPDAIMNEPTVMFQRSAKHRREQFQWACRLDMADGNCF